MLPSSQGYLHQLEAEGLHRQCGSWGGKLLFTTGLLQHLPPDIINPPRKFIVHCCNVYIFEG